MPIPAEYEGLRSFYQVSLISEAILDFPKLKDDPNLTRQMAEIKGLSSAYYLSYALLHDYSAEPFRQMMENFLNDGSINLSNLTEWIESFGASVPEPALNSTHLFDRPSSATVIKVSVNDGWDFFIIQMVSSGHYSVFSLYPEWKVFRWSGETGQITDLNVNGRDEIAITHDDWGTGINHFRAKSFHLYEWNGTAFTDLMVDQLNVSANTDYGACLDISFLPDTGNGQKIQSGTSLSTLCDEAPYQDIVTFAWDGKGYKKESEGITTPGQTDPPSRCTIDWAIKAGPQNDEAVKLLADALENWPAPAENDWGPAARDYLRIKLATWYIERNQLDLGLATLRQVRDHPVKPAYTLPARVAATFLDTYATQGIYRAVEEVGALYIAEMPSVCGMLSCNVEKMFQQWGFAEREWGSEYNGHFSDDFDSLDPIAILVNQHPPSSLDDLKALLIQNQLYPQWSQQGDLDGQGEDDWIVEINTNFYAFLRHGGQIEKLSLYYLYLPDDKSPSTIIWQKFNPQPGAPSINLFKAGSTLYTFLILPQGSAFQSKELLYPGDLPQKLTEKRGTVKDWKVIDGRLIVNYTGWATTYTWDNTQNNLVPSGFVPELQEENVSKAEQALFFDQRPDIAIAILTEIFKQPIIESGFYDDTIIQPLHSYLQYLLGLAYERSGDQADAVQAYWQLWHDYPASPYSLAAQSKLELR